VSDASASRNEQHFTRASSATHAHSVGTPATPRVYNSCFHPVLAMLSAASTFARRIGLLALLGCASHGTRAPVAPEPSPPPPVPPRADVSCAPRNDAVTDSLRVDVTDSADQHAAILVDTTPAPATSSACGAIRRAFVVHTIDPRAARDALDAGIDVLLTVDPAAVAYAATRPDYDSAPLPWNRLYVLAMPGQAADSGRAPALRAELAANAVHAEARAAETPICSPDASPAAPDRRPRIIYAADDSVARGLAERLVALADRPGAPVPASIASAGRLRAVGVPSVALARALASGTDLAYVVALPASSASQCLSVPWTVVSLIETRPRAIVRRAAARLVTDAAGVVRIEAPAP
jgi:hypothetical protein